MSRLLPLLLPLLILLSWALLSYTGTVPAYMLPAPDTVATTLWVYVTGFGTGMYAGRFPADLAASMARIGVGFALATFLGLSLGILSGRSAFMRLLLKDFVDALRSVPGICWLPLALVWFGIGLKTTVFLIALAAFFPIYLNTMAAVTAVPTTYLRAGSMLGLGRFGLMRHVVLPASMGQILSGLRLGLGISFAYLVLGELTGVADGLGALIMDARMVGRVDVIITGILVIALLGWVCDQLLVRGMRLFSRSARRL
ncbi:ABC transporter permease [Desulfonatronum parangueonense]